MTPAIKIRFEPESHQYWLNDTERPGVTSILDAEGLSGCAFWTQRDRDRGSAVHRICHIIGKRPWKGGTASEVAAASLWDVTHTAPVLVPYGMALCAFYTDTQFRPELVEQPVGSAIWGICGTLDQWGALPNKRRLLIDFKSGQPQPAAHIQTALYEMCLKETFGLETDERWVVWLKADGTYKVLKAEPGNGDLSIGLAAINLYKWRAKHNKL